MRLHRFNSPLRAQQAADYLRAHGVDAHVLGDHVHAVFHVRALPWFQVDLVVRSRDELAEGRRLLDEFESLPPIEGDEWEQEALPDLTKLGGDADLPCPTCRHALPHDAALERCPACGGDVDMLTVAVRAVGVDRLSRCFEDPSVLGFLLDHEAVRCRGCGYELAGLPDRGRCPECGSLFERIQPAEPG